MPNIRGQGTEGVLLHRPVWDPELETDPSERKYPGPANAYDWRSASTPDVLKEIHVSEHVHQCRESHISHVSGSSVVPADIVIHSSVMPLKRPITRRTCRDPLPGARRRSGP